MSSPGFPLPRISRTLGIVLAVIGLHLLAIWALQAGLLHRAFNLMEPEVITVELLEPPRPVQAPPPPAPPPQVQVQVQKPAAKPQPPKPAPPPVLAPVITNDPPPPTAPVAVEAPPQPVAPVTAPVQAAAPPSPPAPSPPAPPAPPSPRVELPLSDAAYLRNPPPPYPRVSERLREEGTALVRVLVSVDGLPLRVELQKSTGFQRLDESALKTIPQWKFVPGKRGGVAEQMWVEVPVLFALVKK